MSDLITAEEVQRTVAKAIETVSVPVPMELRHLMENLYLDGYRRGAADAFSQIGYATSLASAMNTPCP